MSWPVVLVGMLPEHLLLAGIVLLLIREVSAGASRAALCISLAAVYAATAAALGLGLEGYTAAPFPGQVSVDPQAFAAKAIILGLAIPVLLISRDDFAGRQFHILLLSALYGACLMVSADTFLTLFIGIELLSLPVYVLVLLAFRRPESAEAALKYLVLGTSYMMLLGLGVAATMLASLVWG